MNNKMNNFDDFLRGKVEEFSSSPSPALRAKMALKVKQFNFWHFNPATFNVFYLSAAIATTATITSYTTGIFSSSDKEEKNETNQIIEAPISDSFPSDSVLFDSLLEKADTLIIADSVINQGKIVQPNVPKEKNKEIPTVTNESEEMNTREEKEFLEDTIKIPHEKIDSTFLPSRNVSPVSDSVQIHRNAAVQTSDTIHKTKHITVIDTITKHERKTVVAKKKRKKK